MDTPSENPTDTSNFGTTSIGMKNDNNVTFQVCMKQIIAIMIAGDTDRPLRRNIGRIVSSPESRSLKRPRASSNKDINAGREILTSSFSGDCLDETSFKVAPFDGASSCPAVYR